MAGCSALRSSARSRIATWSLFSRRLSPKHPNCRTRNRTRLRRGRWPSWSLSAGGMISLHVRKICFQAWPTKRTRIISLVERNHSTLKRCEVANLSGFSQALRTAASPGTRASAERLPTVFGEPIPLQYSLQTRAHQAAHFHRTSRSRLSGSWLLRRGRRNRLVLDWYSRAVRETARRPVAVFQSPFRTPRRSRTPCATCHWCCEGPSVLRSPRAVRDRAD